jgi:hypothetical protein
MEVTRHGNMQLSSSDGAEHSLSKVCLSWYQFFVHVISQSQKQKLDHIKAEPLNGQPSDIERILATLSPKSIQTTRSEADPSSGPSQVTPILKSLPTPYTTVPHQSYSQEDNTVELRRLKQELLAANSKIALQEQELAQTRMIKHTLDQALGPPSEADFSSRKRTNHQSLAERFQWVELCFRPIPRFLGWPGRLTV